MSNILVFGGSGFIGSHLVRRLTQAGHRVAVYDNFHPAAGSSPLLAEVQAQRIEAVRAMAPIVEGDIRDAERVRAAVAETRPELAVFLPSLLASESRNNPDTAVDIHVTGLIHCLRALADQPVRRFVYTSSSFAYGDFLTDPVKEDHPRVPIDVYGRTKLVGEELTVIACQQAKREHVIMRPAAVYGYGDSRGRLIDFMIRRALANEPILLWDPEGRADYTFVDDAADGFFRALFADGAANQAFNLTRGRARTNLEAAEIVCRALPGAVIERVADDKERRVPKRGNMDVSHGKRCMGYDPTVDLEEGIPRVIEQYRRRALFSL